MLNATEKKQHIEYIDNVVKALDILIKEIQKIGKHPINMDRHRRKVISSDIVCDCLYFKNVIEPPDKFIKIQKQINKACDIYLDYYSQLLERIADYDVIWVKRFSAKLAWADRVIVIAWKNLCEAQKIYKGK